MSRGFGRAGTNEGANPASGAVVYYWLKDKPAGDVTLEFLDDSGKLIKKFSSKVPAKKAESRASSAEKEMQEPTPQRGGAPARVTTEQGLNRFEWDLRYPDAVTFPGIVLWAASLRGPAVVPGTYQVRLTVEGETQTQRFEIRKDPRVPTTAEQYTAQLQTALQMRDKVSQTNQATVQIRQVRGQIDELTRRLDTDQSNEKSGAVLDKAKSLAAELTAIEETLYQTKNRASEDPLNFPVRLNNKLAALLTAAVTQTEGEPTVSQQQVYEDLATSVNAQIKKLNDLLSTSVPALNKMVKDQNIPAIAVKSSEEAQ
jgi:hypothetical protein